MTYFMIGSLLLNSLPPFPPRNEFLNQAMSAIENLERVGSDFMNVQQVPLFYRFCKGGSDR